MEGTPINTDVGRAYPIILKGREGRMNGQIIRYLALNGPSLIYSVSKDLASRSETKVHYPTVNRRIHELVRQSYVERAGTKITKAGIAADLYGTTMRGDFAALVGIPSSSGDGVSGLSPNEIRQMIAIASTREGSPFVLFRYILEEGQAGIDLVEKELMPEVISSVRNGFLNIDAAHEGVISSSFASLLASKMTKLLASSEGGQSRTKERIRDQVDILMRSLDRAIATPHHSLRSGKRILRKDTVADPSRLQARKTLMTSASRHQWADEIRFFLKLHSARFV